MYIYINICRVMQYSNCHSPTQQNLNSYFKKRNTCFKQKIA